MGLFPSSPPPLSLCIYLSMFSMDEDDQKGLGETRIRTCDFDIFDRAEWRVRRYKDYTACVDRDAPIFLVLVGYVYEAREASVVALVVLVVVVVWVEPGTYEPDLICVGLA